VLPSTPLNVLSNKESYLHWRMKTTLIYITTWLFLCTLCSCFGHRLHKAQFYNKLGEENATNEGYHANEASRLLDYNEQNKEVNQEHAKKTQMKIGKDLNQLNKPNRYNSREHKAKKLKFQFYM
jgi:hypothetical protein